MSTSSAVVFAALAYEGFQLFSDKCAAVRNMRNEITFVIDHVPPEYHLTELDEMGVWELFLVLVHQERCRASGRTDSRFLEFDIQLNSALRSHRTILNKNEYIISPAYIVRDAIMDVFVETPSCLTHKDYIGLVTRYINPACWEDFLTVKGIEVTEELMSGMRILHAGMNLLQEVLYIIDLNEVESFSSHLWVLAKLNAGIL